MEREDVQQDLIIITTIFGKANATATLNNQVQLKCFLLRIKFIANRNRRNQLFASLTVGVSDTWCGPPTSRASRWRQRTYKTNTKSSLATSGNFDETQGTVKLW